MSRFVCIVFAALALFGCAPRALPPVEPVASGEHALHVGIAVDALWMPGAAWFDQRSLVGDNPLPCLAAPAWGAPGVGDERPVGACDVRALDGSTLHIVAPSCGGYFTGERVVNGTPYPARAYLADDLQRWETVRAADGSTTTALSRGCIFVRPAGGP